MTKYQDKILNLCRSRGGVIVLSILWGIGIAVLFQRVCSGRDCVIIKAPPQADYESSIYQQDEKCYKFKPMTTTCPQNEDKIVKF